MGKQVVNEADIRRAIRAHFLQAAGDRADTRPLLEAAGPGAVLRVLQGMARSGGEDARAAEAFSWDAFFGRSSPFPQLYRRSGLLAAYEEDLFCSSYLLREQAIYALGSLGTSGAARLLERALPWYVLYDPLNLEGLASEILWLAPPVRRWRLLEGALGMMISSPLYLTRWAALEALWEQEGDRAPEDSWGRSGYRPGRVRQLLGRLARDSHPWVRAEGACRLEAYRKGRWPERSRGRGKGRGSEGMLPERPPLTFVGLRFHVGRCMSVLGRSDYDLALVDAIGGHLTARPYVKGQEVRAYWEDFARARGAKRVA